VTAISGEQLAKALEYHGWKLLRINGSHHIYGKDGQVERITVPIHSNQSLKIGLLRHMLKQARLKEQDV
jgi:predicted RNA binding protein YcfA (HicA-like mRNA interferase family)